MTSGVHAGSGAIKRSHIVKQLWSARDDEGDAEQVFDSSAISISDCSWSDEESEVVEQEVDEAHKLSAEEDLTQVRAWLQTEWEKELAKIDWEPEFEHPRREVSAPVKDLNTAVLQRICRGHGPRSSKFEDLLAPLRLTDSGRARRFSKLPLKETFESMQNTLRNWNEHVSADVIDDRDARDDLMGARGSPRDNLMEAMRSRIVFLNRALISRRSADAHDDTCRQLLHAIHVYRPETVDFETQDPMDLLIIIIAHLGYAIPDIDDTLKHRMLYTLVTERGYSTHVANEKTRRKYEEKIADARRRGDVAGAVKFEEKMGDWIRAGVQKNCDNIIEKIKTARRNVELLGLEQLQELAVLQTAQKLVLRDRIRDGKSPSELLVPQSVWWSERAAALDMADSKLREIMTDHIDDLEGSRKVATQAIDDMKYVNNARVLTRALKFNGRDLKNIGEDERNRIVQERMANPGTVVMMTDAVKGITELKANAKDTAKSAAKMGLKADSLLEAVTRTHHEYVALWKLVNSDPHMVLGGENETDFG